MQLSGEVTTMFSCRLFLSVALTGVVLGSAESRAEESRDGKRDTSPTANFPRGDATSDALLLLLRAPAIQRELALWGKQAESLEQLIDDVDEPLWRLRDAQFLNVENSMKAWRLIEQIESRLGEILTREQHTRLRQLVVQARGLHSLLSSDVIQGLKLSSDRVCQIAEIFEETRKETQRLQKESAGKGGVERDKQAEKLLAAHRKKVIALLTNDQKRRWQQLVGTPYDFSQLPRRYVRVPEVCGVDEWLNSSPLTLADLHGKVVVLHFFTFGCINCIHNQPAYKDWHERFSSRGAVVLGIHTPEGEGDRKLESIRKAIQDQGIAYPVAVDNKKENWTTWANHMWPSVYLIDKEGYVRYWWYGELNWQGAQGEKLYREKISELLAEGSEPTRGTTTQNGSRSEERVSKTDAQWRKQLKPEQYNVTRRNRTEPAFTGEYWNCKKKGVYRCVCCGAELFSSDTKFDSGTGWPSFWTPISENAVAERKDHSHSMHRTEVICPRCNAHLGHVFNDGPQPTGLRYCINSVALKLDVSMVPLAETK